jgi:hypothetical protein
LPLADALQEQQAARAGVRLAEELAALDDTRALAIEPDNAWLRLKGLRPDPAREHPARARRGAARGSQHDARAAGSS